MRLTPLLLLTLFFPSCDSIDRLEELSRDSGEMPSGRQDIAPPTTPGDALATIAMLEDARSDGGGLLQVLAGTFGPDVRERAVRALGRLPLETYGEATTRSLCAALTDEAANVRAAAAFALGQRGDAAAADAMMEHWVDPIPEVRVRLVQASTWIDDPVVRKRALSALRSPLVSVRCAAAIAPHAWGADADTDLRLAEAASRPSHGDPRAERFAIPEKELEDPEVTWRALFTLSRRKAEAGRDAFHVNKLHSDPRARMFAIKGLGRIRPHEAGRQALEEALEDKDWRVVVEAARGLGAYADRRSLNGLEQALQHDSPHVRVTVCEALQQFEVENARIAALLSGVRQDPSSTVRGTALIGEVKTRGNLARPEVAEALGDPSHVIRGGAALAAGRLETRSAEELLLSATGDDHPRVAGLAIDALASHSTDEVHARLLELLRSDDNGLRYAAAGALEQQLRKEDIPHLVAAFESSSGDIGVDVQVRVLETLATLKGSAEAKRVVEAACHHNHPWVRRAAANLCSQEPDFPERIEARAELPSKTLRSNPHVTVHTSKGEMTFELFPGEAPVHVHNFLSLARSGHYEGLDFHRVVANFVIQGGCYRGDGHGTGTWRDPADSIRHEFSPRGYARGSLGMPRSTELDSGGSQFFVTHRPTPHLDGRYTILGELRDGFAVLDAIEVGDAILRVSVDD